jgi:uncharacterized membrane protein
LSSIKKVAEAAGLGFAVLLMLGGALNHVVDPDFYARLIPPPVPPQLANLGSAVVEAAIGALLLWPRTRRKGAMAFTALMLLFLPLHIWDVFRDEPAMGSTAAAGGRLAVQAGLIALGAWLSTRGRAP